MRLFLLFLLFVVSSNTATADPGFNQGICNNKNASDKFLQACGGFDSPSVSYGFASNSIKKKYEADCSRDPLAFQKLWDRTQGESSVLYKLSGRCQIADDALIVTRRDVVITGAAAPKLDGGINGVESAVEDCSAGPNASLFRTGPSYLGNASFVIAEASTNARLSCLGFETPQTQFGFGFVGIAAHKSSTIEIANLDFNTADVVFLFSSINSRIDDEFQTTVSFQETATPMSATFAVQAKSNSSISLRGLDFIGGFVDASNGSQVSLYDTTGIIGGLSGSTTSSITLINGENESDTQLEVNNLSLRLGSLLFSSSAINTGFTNIDETSVLKIE